MYFLYIEICLNFDKHRRRSLLYRDQGKDSNRMTEPGMFFSCDFEECGESGIPLPEGVWLTNLPEISSLKISSLAKYAEQNVCPG